MSQRTPPKWNTDAQAELCTTFQELHDALNDAYWAAVDMQKKDRLHGVSDSVFDVLIKFTHGSIRAGSEDYRHLKIEVNRSLKHVKQLKEEIDDLIQAVKKATKVAESVDKTVEIAAKLMV